MVPAVWAGVFVNRHFSSSPLTLRFILSVVLFFQVVQNNIADIQARARTPDFLRVQAHSFQLRLIVGHEVEKRFQQLSRRSGQDPGPVGRDQIGVEILP